jgi:hypothetical protein
MTGRNHLFALDDNGLIFQGTTPDWLTNVLRLDIHN